MNDGSLLLSWAFMMHRTAMALLRCRLMHTRYSKPRLEQSSISDAPYRPVFWSRISRHRLRDSFLNSSISCCWYHIWFLSSSVRHEWGVTVPTIRASTNCTLRLGFFIPPDVVGEGSNGARLAYALERWSGPQNKLEAVCPGYAGECMVMLILRVSGGRHFCIFGFCFDNVMRERGEDNSRRVWWSKYNIKIATHSCFVRKELKRLSSIGCTTLRSLFRTSHVALFGLERRAGGFFNLTNRTLFLYFSDHWLKPTNEPNRRAAPVRGFCWSVDLTDVRVSRSTRLSPEHDCTFSPKMINNQTRVLFGFTNIIGPQGPRYGCYNTGLERSRDWQPTRFN